MSSNQNSQKDQKVQVESMFRYPIPCKQIGIVRIQMVKESRCLYGLSRLKNPEEAVRIVKPLFDMADREMALVMSLSARLEPLAVEIVSVGGLDHCSMDARNIFKHAILNNAASIICFHNHPSGDPTPSGDDRMVSRRLAEAGRLLEIRLVDSIIIGGKDFYSFWEQDRQEGNGNADNQLRRGKQGRMAPAA